MKSNAATQPQRDTSRKTKAELTREKLLAAGIHLFSTYGYNATTTRSVETHAEVQRNLVTYHFGSKEAFWKACVSVLLDRFGESLRPALGQAKDIEPGERARFVIRQFVRSSAAHPEVMRVMFDEGRCDEWRLGWIVENYSRGFYDTVCRLFADSPLEGLNPELTQMQFYYALVSGGVMFAMAPECRLLSGKDPYEEDMIDAQADAIARLLAPSKNGRNS